jgi:hypothetical protein
VLIVSLCYFSLMRLTLLLAQLGHVRSSVTPGV